MDLTRRTLLTGFGAAAVAGGSVAAAPHVAGAQTDNDPGFQGTTPLTLSAAPLTMALTAGLTYRSIDPTAFNPLMSASGRSVSQLAGISISTGAGGLVAPLDVPVGATLREVTVSYQATSAGPVFGVWKKPITGPWAILNDPPAGRALPPAAGIQTATVSLNDPVDGTSTYMVLVNLVSTTNGLLHGLLVGYAPPPSSGNGFVPMNPVRAFDSRQAGYANRGPLTPNTSRVISIKDARDAGGTVIGADVVPIGARAIACNLTTTNTTAANFLALTPGDATSFTASAINWVGPGVSIANGLIVSIDGSRQVKVWCGDQSGSTDVIIDVAGYFMPL
jgi:hypothetical protein